MCRSVHDYVKALIAGMVFVLSSASGARSDALPSDLFNEGKHVLCDTTSVIACRVAACGKPAPEIQRQFSCAVVKSANECKAQVSETILRSAILNAKIDNLPSDALHAVYGVSECKYLFVPEFCTKFDKNFNCAPNAYKYPARQDCTATFKVYASCKNAKNCGVILGKCRSALLGLNEVGKQKVDYTDPAQQASVNIISAAIKAHEDKRISDTELLAYQAFVVKASANNEIKKLDDVYRSIQDAGKAKKFPTIESQGQ